MGGCISCFLGLTASSHLRVSITSFPVFLSPPRVWLIHLVPGPILGCYEKTLWPHSPAWGLGWRGIPGNKGVAAAQCSCAGCREVSGHTGTSSIPGATWGSEDFPCNGNPCSSLAGKPACPECWGSCRGAIGAVRCPQDRKVVTRETSTTVSHVPVCWEHMWVLGGWEDVQGTEHPHKPQDPLKPTWPYGWGRRCRLKDEGCPPARQKGSLGPPTHGGSSRPGSLQDPDLRAGFWGWRIGRGGCTSAGAPCPAAARVPAWSCQAVEARHSRPQQHCRRKWEQTGWLER